MAPARTLYLFVALWLPHAALADCGVTATGIPEDAVASIDPEGIRHALANYGLGVAGFYAAEGFDNLSGGMKQGATYDGVLELELNGDMRKMGLWKGLCFFANGYQIHGNSITADNIGSLMPVSNLEATPSTKLYELWFEQHLFADHLAVKFGQLAADGEFAVSQGGAYFLNGTWGWPAIAAGDLPSGGPSYPLATPGVRLTINPNGRSGLMAAIYNGDPAGPNCTGDPQVCDENGVEFRLSDPPLVFAEGFYKYNQAKLAGIIKIGAWHHFGKFEDQHFDSGGPPLDLIADPGGALRGDHAIYAVIDQLIWRVPDSQEPKGVGLFGRIFGAPSDRNLVDFYADAGVTFTGVILQRPNDTLSVGLAYTHISDQVHASDVQTGLSVERNFEMLFEICYTMQLRNGWWLQPDLQYIVHPGGNVPDTNGDPVGNATVLGIRSTLSF